MNSIEKLKKLKTKEIGSQELRDSIYSLTRDYDSSDHKDIVLEERGAVAEKMYKMVLDHFPEAVVESTPAPRAKRKMTKQDHDKCTALVAEMKALIARSEGKKVAKKASSKTTTKTTKRASSVIADNFSRSISGAVKKDLTKEKAARIKISHIRKAKDHFKQGLKDLSTGLGGLSDSSSSMIKRFDKSIEELIAEIEKIKKN